MADYEEIVSGTVDEVKEKVQEEDLDPEEVLEAEKQNKDRVTLVEWLEERIEDEESGVETGQLPEESGGGLWSRITDRAFVSGFVAGAVLVLAASFAAPMVMGMSPVEAGQHLEDYFNRNSADIPLQNVSVTGVERMNGSSMYRADLVMTAEVMNRTVSRQQTAVMTSDGRYVFLSPPIDTTSP
ncbi:MAG: hypothetical protein ABEJ62_02220, partial [Candidatus Nanohaloarchaea archaeon]